MNARGELLKATKSANTHLSPPDNKIITLATSPYRTGGNRNPTFIFWEVAHLSRAGDTGYENACLLAAQPLEEREQVEELARMLWTWK